jgi:hypothetical protein
MLRGKSICKHPLNEKTYRGRIPPKLILEISLLEPLSEDWKVEEVTGDVGVTEQKPMDPAPSEVRDEATSHKSQWYLRGLEPNKAYTLHIYLHPKRERAIVPAALEAIRNKRLTASFLSREK